MDRPGVTLVKWLQSYKEFMFTCNQNILHDIAIPVTVSCAHEGTVLVSVRALTELTSTLRKNWNNFG